MSTQTVNVATPTDREVVITRSFDAPRALVFAAHTKPELVRRWLLGPPGWTMPVCEIDLRVGGKYRYQLQSESGERMGWGGEFRDIAATDRLVATEVFDQDWTQGGTLNTMTLAERGNGTELKLTVLYTSKEARDGALATGMTTGMDAGYGLLDTLLVELEAAEG